MKVHMADCAVETLLQVQLKMIVLNQELYL